MGTQAEHATPDATAQAEAPAPAHDDAASDALREGEHAYPAGFEPQLEGEQLEAARRKERRYTWLVRIQLFMLLLIAALVLYFIFTS